MKFYKIITILSFWVHFSTTAIAYSDVCNVVNTPSFRGCLGMTMTPTVCAGYPPRPCTHFSYYVPQYYIEVTDSKETFFHGFPGIESQLARTADIGIQVSTEDDHGAFSYQAHTINVPYASWAFNELPCEGAMYDLYCFSAMSEDLGMNWKTGAADLAQPSYLLWSQSPKGCIIKGAATGFTGEPHISTYPYVNSCSYNKSTMTQYPPSNASVCTAWGIHFPRYGTVTSSDQTTASLVIASRIKSLGAEVFQSVPTSANEKWQMIAPQNSSCFKEGQNISILLLNQVNEIGRLQGKLKNYLYVVWKQVSCTKDVYWGPFSNAWLTGLENVCRSRSGQ